MKTKQLVLVALLAWGAAANAQEEKKEKKSFGFDVTNVSLGIGLSEAGGIDPNNFTFGEFADYRGTLIDLGMSANVYGKWNLRMHLGYIAGAIDPVDYFDQVMPFEEVEGVYDDVNGSILEWNPNGIVPESFVLLNLGVSRTFKISNIKVTPFVSAWCSNERARLMVDGYEVIATGEYIDETLMAYEDWGISFLPYLGFDLEMGKYLFGMGLIADAPPLPTANLRIGYQF